MNTEREKRGIVAIDGKTYAEAGMPTTKHIYPEAESEKALEKDHGRIEKREYYLTTDISWLDDTEKRDELRANHNERREIFHYIAYEY